jgi:hypothetical protein
VGVVFHPSTVLDLLADVGQVEEVVVDLLWVEAFGACLAGNLRVRMWWESGVCEGYWEGEWLLVGVYAVVLGLWALKLLEGAWAWMLLAVLKVL